MYIIFKVCLEYYLYIKYNNKKLVLFTSTSSFKEYVKTTWSKKMPRMTKPHRLCSIENLNIIFTLKNLSNY